MSKFRTQSLQKPSYLSSEESSGTILPPKKIIQTKPKSKLKDQESSIKPAHKIPRRPYQSNLKSKHFHIII